MAEGPTRAALQKTESPNTKQATCVCAMYLCCACGRQDSLQVQKVVHRALDRVEKER